MDSLVYYGIWASVILAGLGIASIALFGLRSLTFGKVNPVSAVILLIPVVLIVVFYFVIGHWVTAAVWTLFVMFGLALLSLVLSGVRGLFT